jgi:hypothetical protein
VQFLDTQVEQLESEPVEGTKFPPEEKPKVEKSFLISALWHWGQFNFSELLALCKISNLFSQFKHRYSYIGITLNLFLT